MDSISSLERAQAHFHNGDGIKGVGNGGLPDGDDHENPISQRGAIREAIAVMPGEFSSRDILQFLRDFHPSVHSTLKPEVLSNALYKFTRDGVIKQVRQGTRGRPSGFVKVEASLTMNQPGDARA